MHTLSDHDRQQHIAAAVEAPKARMTRRFIDVDETFAQLASELHWQTEQAAWGCAALVASSAPRTEGGHRGLQLGGAKYRAHTPGGTPRVIWRRESSGTPDFNPVKTGDRPPPPPARIFRS